MRAGAGGTVLFTLIENGRLHVFDPCLYLEDVMTRLPAMTNREMPQLTPLNWLHARQAAGQPTGPWPPSRAPPGYPASVLKHRK